MLIEPFSRKKDFPELNSWLSQRSMALWEEDFLPEIGFTVFIEGTPIAMGFLRYCEPNIGIMDSFVTNPTAISSYRYVALNGLTDSLIKEAKEIGLKSLIVFTTEQCIIERADTYGFNVIPNQVMVKNF